MAHTIVYGSAMPVDAEMDGNVRNYHADGKWFIGHDTHDVDHVCSQTCAADVLYREGFVSDDRPGTVRSYYVKANEPDNRGYVPTADVQGADYGGDPHVRCAGCGVVLHRDDDAYLTMFGRPIPEEGDEE